MTGLKEFFENLGFTQQENKNIFVKGEYEISYVYGYICVKKRDVTIFKGTIEDEEYFKELFYRL